MRLRAEAGAQQGGLLKTLYARRQTAPRAGEPEPARHRQHELSRRAVGSIRQPRSLGVPLPTIEKLLNHVSGSFGGIVSVYQRYNWLPEMREAMQKWEARPFDAA